MATISNIGILSNGFGTDYAAGTATGYIAGTSTLATWYEDSAGATPAANPYTLSADGKATLYADRYLKIDVKNNNGVSAPGFPVDNLRYWPTASEPSIKYVGPTAEYDFTSLADAATSADAANKTVVVSTDLTVTTLVWPSDRVLQVIDNAIITVTGTLTINSPTLFTHWPFAGAGTVAFTTTAANSMSMYSTQLDLRASESTDQMVTPTTFAGFSRGLSFGAPNSAGDKVVFAGVHGRATDKTAGAEGGQLWFYTNDGGTYLPMGHFTQNGELIVSPSDSTDPASLFGLVNFIRGDSTDEASLALENSYLPSGADSPRAWLSFVSKNSSGDRMRYAYIRSEAVSITPTQEQGQIRFAVRYVGAQAGSDEGRMCMVFGADGLYGQKNKIINVATSPYAPDPLIYSHAHFVNNGATTTIQFDLPQIVTSGDYYNVGAEFTFTTIEAAQLISLHPYSGQKILSASGTDQKWNSPASAGNSITVVAIGQNTWQVTSQIGTWVNGGT